MSKRLGKGLQAIFGDDAASIIDDIEKGIETSVNYKHKELNVNDIIANPYQPRREFDLTALNELKESILQHGVITPVLVRQSSIKGYELIAGERRLRASKLAERETIPAIIVDFNDDQMMEVSLIENIQREDLNVVEEAKAYQQMIDRFGYTQEKLADKMNKSRSYITNLTRLLKLPREILQLVVDNKLTTGHVRPLITLDSEEEMIKLAKIAVRDNLSVRQVEQLTKKHPTEKIIIKKKPKKEYQYPIELLEKKFQTKVNIDKNNITIHFSDTDDLNRILELMEVLEEM